MSLIFLSYTSFVYNCKKLYYYIDYRYIVFIDLNHYNNSYY
uniref:Uncharacterized protein n=1 Tax=Osmundaria fimbriata TaxID=228265 RepID=A0A1Z1M4Q8_OSMFI|nr:hypothetical protein [Osmundaria fimbriata]ARW60754.1 hypothetical protein [Osmundaria fimbriata]